MRPTHSGRSLPLLTTSKRSARPSRGVVSWLGGMTVIALVLLLGWQTFPQHIQASLITGDHDFPNIAAAHLNATRQQAAGGGVLTGMTTTRQVKDTDAAGGHTMVTYLVGNTMGLDGPTASELGNFEFFIKHGIQQHAGVFYVLFMHKVRKRCGCFCCDNHCTINTPTHQNRHGARLWRKQHSRHCHQTCGLCGMRRRVGVGDCWDGLSNQGISSWIKMQRIYW